MGKDSAPKFLKAFKLPYIWPIQNKTTNDYLYEIPEKYTVSVFYEIHHIQYRCLSELAPYIIDVFPVRKMY